LLTKLVLLGALCSSAWGTAFFNGSFENPGGDPIRQSLVNGDTFVSGWVNNGGFQVYASANPTDGISAGDGTYWVSFGHNGATGGTLSQTFDTVIGTTYFVNFLQRVQQGTVNQSMQLSAFSGAETTTVSSTISNSLAWGAGPTLTFTAAATTSTLQFLDTTDGAHGGSNWALDGVTVDLVPPSVSPEPSTAAITILGLGLLAVVRKRRAIR